MLPAQPCNAAGTESSQDELDDLEKLAAELRARGYKAHLATPPGKLPRLETRNPQAPALSERIYAQADSFFWPWADPIASRDQVTDAADIITRVLRTASSHQP